MRFYAHSLERQLPEKWQKLEDHLRNVAEMARGFAEPFDSGDWAWNAGWWNEAEDSKDIEARVKRKAAEDR